MLKDRPKSRKQLLDRLEAQRQEMRRHATVLPPDGADDRRRRSAEDFWYFCRTYLPHYFTVEAPDFHRELRDEANKPGINALAAPRGFAKSTIVTFADTLYDCVTAREPFTIIVKETHEAAIDEVASVQLELEENPRILADYGAMKKHGEWEDGDFTTTTGCRVLALGVGQSIRGKKHRQHRPGKVKIDDPEKDKTVRNQRLNKERVDWVLEAVYPSLDPNGGTVTWLGTMMSKRSGLAMLMNRAKDAPINCRVWAATDKTGASIWPARFPAAKLAEIRKLVGLKAWLQEYMNAPSDDPGATFQETMIHRYRESEVDPAMVAATVTACDPSYSDKGNFKSIITIRVMKEFRGKKGPYYLITAPWVRQTTIDTMLRHLFVVNAKLSPSKMGIETQGGQILLLRDIRRMETDHKVRLPIQGMKSTIAKEARVARLSVMMENEQLLFPEDSEDPDLQELITQFLGFDDTAIDDDGPDGTEMAMRLAERKGAAGTRVRSW